MTEPTKTRSFGPLYWRHQRLRSRLISKGEMRMTEPPYKWGSGVRIGIGKHSFDIGVCHKKKFGEDDSALFAALEGREVADIDEVARWNNGSGAAPSNSGDE